MKKKVVLNMIVKNENHVIERCLNSVKRIIDFWVIVDTGSTDGTQETIRNCLKDVPGSLYERPWVDFEFNRNEALQLAKNEGDYLLIIDADDYLEYDKDFFLPKLNLDGYLIYEETLETNPRSFQHLLLIGTHLPWKWEGVIHEELICKEATRFSLLPKVTYIFTHAGARSLSADKFLKDAETLKEAHQNDPTNPRYPFYLGITYDAIQLHEPALKYYTIRSSMQGTWDEENFYTQYRIAELQRKLKKPGSEILQNFSRAYEMRPHRVEPLFWLSQWAIDEKNNILAYLLLKEAITIPHSKSDSLYVENWIYQYGALLQFVKISFALGRYSEALNAIKRVKKTPNIPPSVRKIVEENLPLIQEKLRAQSSS